MGGRAGSTPALEIIGLSMSNYSWRKRNIDASFDNIGRNIRSCDIENSVCVNNVIHMMLQRTGEILAFDLRTNVFSIVKVPLDDLARMNSYENYPYLMKISGCIGVACDYLVTLTGVVYIWILKDYENHVWVKETVTIPQSWKVLGHPMLLDSVSTDEFILSVLRKVDNVVSVPIYNMKSQCFRFVKFTLDRPKLFSQDLCFGPAKCYLESITPL
ncbi:putative F-box protein At4g38870 [Bidens hawaiensis]|uniref:putative F-box protein At4g38870 n=1 Tax=Bidens hawaiensis TaxID=980011 RepID=UPI00404A1A1B